MTTTKVSVGDRIRAVVHTPPMKFQIRGVRFLERRKGRALIGDDMGLGKTYQALSYLKLHPQVRPCVIVCPASLKYNWERELWTHARLDATVAEGRQPSQLDGNIWILNYDILPFWLTWLLTQNVQIVIIDECHKIKNREAQRTVACRTLVEQCPQVIGLSGTPITNGPVEFFPILNMIDPVEFPSFTDYAFAYCNPRFWRGQMRFNGASNLEELRVRIAPYILRRMKSEVLTELPRTTRTIIPVEIPRKEYEHAKNEFIAWLTEVKGKDAAKRAKGAEAIVKLGQLKQLAARLKLPMIQEWVGDWREQTKQKLVIFGIHKRMIAELVTAFPASVVVTGSVSNHKRQIAVDQFQTDPKIPFFIGNLQAAGEGITLTAASTTAHTELGWVPAAHDQADDRVNRIGQIARHVDAYYFVARDTVEEKGLKLLDIKRRVVGRVLDGVEIQKVQFQLIADLLKGRT